MACHMLATSIILCVMMYLHGRPVARAFDLKSERMIGSFVVSGNVMRGRDMSCYKLVGR